MASARLEVDYTKWEAIRDKFTELHRQYTFKNFAGPGTTTRVDLRCRLTVENGRVAPFVYLVINPYLLEQSQFLGVIFGPSDDLINYKVLQAKIEAAATGINFIVFDASDGEHLLSILMLGREITVTLITQTESIARIPLHNDIRFRIEYETLKASLLGRDGKTSSTAMPAPKERSNQDDEGEKELGHGTIALSVNCGEWHREQVPNSMAGFSGHQARELSFQLSRIYDFAGLPPPGDAPLSQEWYVAKSQIGRLTFICGIQGRHTDFGRDWGWGSFGLRRDAIHSIHSSLFLRFWPLRLPNQMNLMVGLFTADKSTGALCKGLATPMEGDPNSILLGMFDGDGASKFMKALLSGTQLTFTLINGQHSVARLPVPNDLKFKELYEQTYNTIERAQDSSKRLFG